MPSRNVGTFTIQWAILASSVGRNSQTVPVKCKSVQQCRSLYAKWHAYKSALRANSSLKADLSVADNVVAHKDEENTTVVFYPREEAWDAYLLQGAIQQSALPPEHVEQELRPEQEPTPPASPKSEQSADAETTTASEEMQKAFRDLGFVEEEGK